MSRAKWKKMQKKRNLKTEALFGGPVINLCPQDTDLFRKTCPMRFTASIYGGVEV